MGLVWDSQRFERRMMERKDGNILWMITVTLLMAFLANATGKLNIDKAPEATPIAAHANAVR